jgi:hypothetical protein
MRHLAAGWSNREQNVVISALSLICHRSGVDPHYVWCVFGAIANYMAYVRAKGEPSMTSEENTIVRENTTARDNDDGRITIRLGGAARAAVDKIRRMRGANINEVIRRAIGTELFLLQEQERGAKILIQDRDGTRQLVLR